MRDVIEWVLDTETTGTSVSSGDRILEIGAVELKNKKPTGRFFHEYIDPEMEVPEEAVEIHGITRDEAISLGQGQKFKDIAQRLFNLLEGTRLVIHNAPFDMGFLEMEFSKVGIPNFSDSVKVLDTLTLARNRFPNNRNTLDALCKRFNIDNSSRDHHGALLDAELLSSVYISLSATQQSLKINNRVPSQNTETISFTPAEDPSVLLELSESQSQDHEKYISEVSKEAGLDISWDI